MPVAIVVATAAAVVAAVWIAGPATETVREAPADTGVVSTPGLGGRFGAGRGARSIRRRPPDTDPPIAARSRRACRRDHRGRLRPRRRHVRASRRRDRQRRRVPHQPPVAGHPDVDRRVRRAGVRGHPRSTRPRGDLRDGDRRSVRIRPVGADPRPLAQHVVLRPATDTSGSSPLPETPTASRRRTSCRRGPVKPVALEPIASALPDGFVGLPRRVRGHGRFRCLVVASFPDPWREACVVRRRCPHECSSRLAAPSSWWNRPPTWRRSRSPTSRCCRCRSPAAPSPIVEHGGADPRLERDDLRADLRRRLGDGHRSRRCSCSPARPTVRGYPLERAADGTWSTSRRRDIVPVRRSEPLRRARRSASDGDLMARSAADPAVGADRCTRARPRPGRGHGRGPRDHWRRANRGRDRRRP